MEQSVKITITSVAIASNGAVFKDAEECAAYEQMIEGVKKYADKYGEKRNLDLRVCEKQRRYVGSSFFLPDWYTFVPKDI